MNCWPKAQSPLALFLPLIIWVKDHGSSVLVKEQPGKPNCRQRYDDSVVRRIRHLASTFILIVVYTLPYGAVSGKTKRRFHLSSSSSSAGRAGPGSPTCAPCCPRDWCAGILPLRIGRPWSLVLRRWDNTTCGRALPNRLPAKTVKKAGAAQVAPSISADASAGRCLLAKANIIRTKATGQLLTGPRRPLSGDLRSGRSPSLDALTNSSSY